MNITDPPALPTHITHAQVRAACEALGFDPKLTTGILVELNIGIKNVYVTHHLLCDGKIFMVGDMAARTTTEIPVRTPDAGPDFDWAEATEELRRLNELLDRRENGDD